MWPLLIPSWPHSCTLPPLFTFILWVLHPLLLHLLNSLLPEGFEGFGGPPLLSSPDQRQCLVPLQAHHFFPRENSPGHTTSSVSYNPLCLDLLASQPIHCPCHYKCQFTFNGVIFYYLSLSSTEVSNHVVSPPLLTSSTYVAATEQAGVLYLSTEWQ